MSRRVGRGAVTRTTLLELPTLRALPIARNPPASNKGSRPCTTYLRGRHGTTTPALRTTGLASAAIYGVTDRAVTRETDGATRCASRRTDLERREPGAYQGKPRSLHTTGVSDFLQSQPSRLQHKFCNATPVYQFAWSAHELYNQGPNAKAQRRVMRRPIPTIHT